MHVRLPAYRPWMSAVASLILLGAALLLWYLWFGPGQYDVALIKWQAQHITAYEITTHRIGLADSLFGPTVTLRVSNGGQTIEIVGPTGVTTTTHDTYYQARTVEGMFAETKRLRDTPQAGTNYRMEYHAQYDPILGYITVLEAQSVPDVGVSVFDADWTLKVENFKVLQRGAP